MMQEDEAQRLLDALYAAIDAQSEPARSALIGFMDGLFMRLEALHGVPEARDAEAFSSGMVVGNAYADVVLYVATQAPQEIVAYLEDTPERSAQRRRSEMRAVDDDDTGGAA